MPLRGPWGFPRPSGGRAGAAVITLALSKGRIFDETLPLLQAAGIRIAEDPDKSRKLIVGTSQPGLRVVLVRASDVPTYVQHGGADLGVAGLDVLSALPGAVWTARFTGRADLLFWRLAWPSGPDKADVLPVRQ